MKVVRSEIPDVLILEPKVFGDERGYFLESYNKRALRDATGIAQDFVQDNHSRSGKNVLRGLHYQIGQPQGKLVRVIQGTVFDVAVDLRRSSPTFGRWVGFELSAENKRVAWVPEGFAHGFLVLSDVADFVYKATAYFAPSRSGLSPGMTPTSASTGRCRARLYSRTRIGGAWRLAARKRMREKAAMSDG